MNIFHSLVSFNTLEYRYANHYIQDTRISGKGFSLINALSQYDSQWYIKIAERGYPDHPHSPLKLGAVMDGLLYNFFPLYPITIAVANVLIHNVLISAFLVSNVLLLASCYSLFYVVSQWFSKQVALRTLLLMLLFPFGIFLRGYYSEDLRLLLFIWFCYGVTKNKFFLAAITVGLLSITNGIALLLLPFYCGVLWFFHKKLTVRKTFLYGIVAVIPFFSWMIFCYVHTGDPLIFVRTRSAWERPPFFPPFYNIWLLLSFPFLQIQNLYASRLDVLWILITVCVTFLSKRVLPKVVWLATIILAFTPLLVQDSVSFMRFSSVLFPFFVYLAVVLKKKYYIILVCLFGIGILISSLYFINWYWIE